MPIDDRYQNQSWPVKLWRYRQYLPIPYFAALTWYHEHIRPLEDEDDWRMRFTDCWSLATGIAQGKMQWWYTSEELGINWSDVGEVEDGELQESQAQEV